MNSYQQHHTPEDVNPAPRRMDFEFSDTIDKFIYKDNPVLSAWGAAMSTVFPDGERFFIESVRNFEKEISDPQLRKAIKAFIGQEAHHGREHDALNEWFESKGLDVSKAQEKLKKDLDFFRKLLSNKQQLAVTVALEHFTAMLADVFLGYEDVREGMDPRIEAVFYWHAIEETEHKAVAYDVYEAVGGGYLTRSSIMLGVTLVLIYKIIVIQNQFLSNWKELGNGKSWLATIKYFWGSPGFLRRTLPSYLRFFKPGFHPWQEDNRDLLKNWQEKIESSVNETERNFTIQETGTAKTATA